MSSEQKIVANTKEEAALNFRQEYIIPSIYDGDYRLSLEDAFLAGVKWANQNAMAGCVPFNKTENNIL